MSKPRDLGLLLWCLVHRVKVELPLTEQWIELARNHCQMSPKRLAELRAEPYRRYWTRMEQKRERRLAYFRVHGEVPQGWTPPAPGEQDRTYQAFRMKLYWQTRAKLKARLRKRPEAMTAKLTNAYLATRKIRSRSRKIAALNAVESMLFDQVVGASAELSFRDYLDVRWLGSVRQEEFMRLSRGRKVFEREAERIEKAEMPLPVKPFVRGGGRTKARA